jgi:hypothetical protein
VEDPQSALWRTVGSKQASRWVINQSSLTRFRWILHLSMSFSTQSPVGF